LLTELNLYYNGLSGPIPGCIGKLTKLQYLILSGNKLDGVLPVGICNLVDIIELEIEDTSVEGVIPECIGALTKMSHLSLSLNRLTGPVPESIGQLVRLKGIWLAWTDDTNTFTGPLPASMSNL
jgi:hypothetical protein